MLLLTGFYFYYVFYPFVSWELSMDFFFFILIVCFSQCLCNNSYYVWSKKDSEYLEGWSLKNEERKGKQLQRWWSWSMLHLWHYNTLPEAFVWCFTGSDHFWTIIFWISLCAWSSYNGICCYVFGFKMGDPLRVSCSVFFFKVIIRFLYLE